MASDRNFVHGIFRFCSAILEDDFRLCKLSLERVHDEKLVKMKAGNVPKQCSAKQEDLSALPVRDREDDVIFGLLGQRAILQQLSSAKSRSANYLRFRNRPPYFL